MKYWQKWRWTYFEALELPLDIIEGRMKGRPKRGRKSIQVLHMLSKDGYVALKREAEDRWRWSHIT